jgi:hypothetical protein
MGEMGGDFRNSNIQRLQKTFRDACGTSKDMQRYLENFDIFKDTQRCLETFYTFKDTQRSSKDTRVIRHFTKTPGATQGVKYTLRDTKLPRATWVSPGSNPFFLMSHAD